MHVCVCAVCWVVRVHVRRENTSQVRTQEAEPGVHPPVPPPTHLPSPPQGEERAYLLSKARRLFREQTLLAQVCMGLYGW